MMGGYILILGLLLVTTATQNVTDNNRDIWVTVKRNVENQLSRLNKLTMPYNCAASCHFSVHKDLVDYETAKKNCEEAKYIGFPTPGGRRLMTVHSELENRLAWYAFRYAYGDKELAGKRYEEPTNWAWIGLEKKMNNNKRPDGAGKVVWDAGDWEWVDGNKMTPASYSNWLTKHDNQVQPDMWSVEGAHQSAARIYRKPNRNGVWDDTFKAMKHPYICQFNLPVHYVVYPELKTWDEAKIACEERGFYFAKIRNKAENDLFVKAVQVAYGEDRYEKKFHHENWIWIGATDLEESGVFKFYDGEEIKFTVPWAKKQHDNKTTKKQGSQDYVAVSRWGEWDDSYGLHWKRPFACQCSPQGIQLDNEMEEINRKWENLEKKKQAEKERKKQEKAARIEQRKKNKEERKKKKADRKEQKQQQKDEKAAKKAKKEERKKDKAAKKEERKQDKAAKKEKKQAKKEENAAKKEQKKADKIKNKEEKAAKKADKKVKKQQRKEEASDAQNSYIDVSKRQWPNFVRSKRQWPNFVRSKRQWPNFVRSKRQWPNFVRSKRQWPNFDRSKRQWPNFDRSKRQWPNFVRSKRQWPNFVRSKRQWPNFDRSKRQWPNFVRSKRQWPNLDRSKRQWPNFVRSKRQFPEFKVSKRELPVLNSEEESDDVI